MIIRTMIRALTVALLLASALVVSDYGGALPEAAAQSRSLDEGPVVRRVLLYRSDRFEIGGSPIALTLGDMYQRNPMLQVVADYHLTNYLSLGINAGFSPFMIKTSTARNFESSNPLRARNVDFARPTLLSDIHLGVVPFSGKLNQSNRGVIPFDFHILAGFGMAMIKSDNDDLSGMRVGPTFAVGLRFFVTDSLAIWTRLQDYIYPSLDAAMRGNIVEEKWQHTLLFSIGVSTFSPSSLRVSR